jgi:hypothetical protein
LVEAPVGVRQERWRHNRLLKQCSFCCKPTHRTGKNCGAAAHQCDEQPRAPRSARHDQAGRCARPGGGRGVRSHAPRLETFSGRWYHTFPAPVVEEGYFELSKHCMIQHDCPLLFLYWNRIADTFFYSTLDIRRTTRSGTILVIISTENISRQAA